MKNSPVRAELFQADERTDKHGEAKSLFAVFRTRLTKCPPDHAVRPYCDIAPVIRRLSITVTHFASSVLLMSDLQSVFMPLSILLTHVCLVIATHMTANRRGRTSHIFGRPQQHQNTKRCNLTADFTILTKT